MTLRIAIVGAAVAGLVLTLLLVLGKRGDSGDKSHKRAPAADAVKTDAQQTNATARRERPALRGVSGMVTGTGPRPELKSGAYTTFAAESREPAWADAKEKSVRTRVDGLLADHPKVRVPKIECRSTRCSLVVVGGDSKALRRFLAVLETERGFYKRAKQLVMYDYRPTENAKDESSLGVLLEYAR